MNILIIHNIYSSKGGEESVVALQKRLLEQKGDRVFTYFRDYNEIKGWKFGKLASLFSSLGNRKSSRDIERIVTQNRIDIALIHNVFPIISPSILPTLKKHGVEIRWVAHNYRLLCPNGLFYTHGKVCEKCCTTGKELHCIANRCEGSLLGSIGYAARNFAARTVWKWHKECDKFMVLTCFQRNKFVDYGIESSKIVVTGNSCTSKPFEQPKGYKRDNRVLFVGRLSEEKGVETLLKVAREMTTVEFVVAGGGTISKRWGDVPPNLKLLGNQSQEELIELYRTVGVTIITSHCYEGFPLIILEASLQRCPVIAPNLGSSSTIITNNVDGLHYNPMDIESLKAKIEAILSSPELGARLSKAAQQLCLERYSTESYYNSLIKGGL